ncbi:MMPL family transporter [Mammaliicoccus fleurettii]|uniref:MMPL family transporter n=1 Tax=Mammaliicoccus fleurettii TaxID=150056 RepID=UPI001AACA203|nr:MMPL family transporter [Mammaliicoccus fleurettii]MBO3061581.1 MMPL family transporter [Mammaliicoccus fleurettii]MEB7806064.1 MMPL family transporter [Mammaliicoccus fleurettii]
MANFLFKLGSSIAKHKWLTIIIWVVVLAGIITPLAINKPTFDNDITMNGIKSIDTNDKIEKEFNQDSEKANVRVVFKSDDKKGITDKKAMKEIQDALKDAKDKDDDIKEITDPYKNKQINKDQTTAFADINYKVSQTSIKSDSVDKVKDVMKPLDDEGIQTELTGNALNASTEIGGSSEAIGIIIAFVVLLVTFGSLIAAGMPIISALVGLGSSIGAIALLTYSFDIPNVTLSLAVMIGLALGIDYALFILFRYRQIIKTEQNHVKAIGLALGTAGSAVIFAGVTVVIAVCGLGLVGIDFLSIMGYASALSVVFAVLSSITLLPAVISVFHKQIHPKKRKIHSNESLDTPWSKFVVGKPWIAILVGLVILIAAALPVTHMRLGIPDNGMKPDTSTEKKAYDIISDDFGEGFNGPIVMLVDTSDKKDDQQALQKDLQGLMQDVNDIKNVETVTPPQLNKDQDYALVTVLPKKGPNAESTYDLVHDLRDYNSDSKDKYDLSTEISGQSVINIDMSEKLNEAIPLFAGVIILLAFVLLMVVFRSIIIPLKAVLGFVLSLAATLGFTTLVMQDGFMSGLFGVDTTGPLLAFLPVITIGLLFGLAMDYEVFLMSRIHEEYVRTMNNTKSIKVGLKESGPVIVAAALIMFSVFIGFVFQDDVMIKSMGIALAFGVLFDAFVVRMTIIPALTKLFGRASWYLPNWLNTILPKIDIEGHALSENNSVEQTTENKNVSTIEVSPKTKDLYDNIDSASKDEVLYKALSQYNNKIEEQQHSETDNENIMSILNQQSKNIEQVNHLIERMINKDK